ncbi:unnamed protein product [Gadus morhua 'NCC']
MGPAPLSPGAPPGPTLTAPVGGNVGNADFIVAWRRGGVAVVRRGTGSPLFTLVEREVTLRARYKAPGRCRRC